MKLKERLSRLEADADEVFFSPLHFFNRQATLPRAEQEQRLKEKELSDEQLEELCRFAYQENPELETMSDEELEALCRPVI